MKVKELIEELEERLPHWEEWANGTHFAELNSDDISLVREALEIIKSDYEY